MKLNSVLLCVWCLFGFTAAQVNFGIFFERKAGEKCTFRSRIGEPFTTSTLEECLQACFDAEPCAFVSFNFDIRECFLNRATCNVVPATSHDLFERLYPTASPTQKPSKSPTSRPSTSPTKSPSTTPPRTNFPTSPTFPSPTARPTRFPTVSPTLKPTQNPTTFTLTAKPSHAPTQLPTQMMDTNRPTRQPTTLDTVQATQSPTREVSRHPTISPTSLSRVTASPTGKVPAPSSDALSAEEGGGYCKGEFIAFGSIDAVVVVSGGAAIAGVLVALTGCVAVWSARKLPVFEASCWQLLIVFCFGLLIVNLGVFPDVMTVFSPSQQACVGSAFLLYCGFAICLSTLMVKQWRNWQLVEALENGKRVNQRLISTYALVVLPVFCVLILVLVWTGAFRPSPNPCKEFQCDSSSIAFPYLPFCMMILLSALSLGLNLLLHDVPCLAKESSYIRTLVLFSLVFLILLGAVFYSDSIGISSEILLRSIVICFLSCQSVYALVWKKWLVRGMAASNVTQQLLDTDKRNSNNSDDASRPADFATTTQRPLNQSSWGASSTTSSTRFDQNEIYRTFSQPQPGVYAQRRGRLSYLNQNNLGKRERPGERTSNLPVTETVELQGKRDDSEEGSMSTEVLQQRGFKVGEADDSDEYIDRKTGETFWLHRSTGQVSKTKPENLQKT